MKNFTQYLIEAGYDNSIRAVTNVIAPLALDFKLVDLKDQPIVSGRVIVREGNFALWCPKLGINSWENIADLPRSIYLDKIKDMIRLSWVNNRFIQYE